MNAVDTNIFVYALSADEPIRGPKAAELIDQLSASDTVLLWQVACEFGAVVSRLHREHRVSEEAFETITAVRRRFSLVLPSSDVLDIALGLHRKHDVSYWDAMLLAACEDAGVKRLLTEDLQHGATFLGVSVVNPFKS